MDRCILQNVYMSVFQDVSSKQKSNWKKPIDICPDKMLMSVNW